LISLLLLIINLSASASIDSIPLISINNLKHQKSFGYRYQFKSDIPHSIFGSFSGCVVFPSQEQRQGTLIRGNKKTKINIKARKDCQYEVFKKKWQIVPRGEESDIIISLDRTITDARFQLISDKKESYLFQFIPHLSFLDPTFTRKFTAVIEIDKKIMLPKKIIAQDSAKKILWQLDFSNYNKIKRINFPFEPNLRITLAAEQKLSKSETGTILSILSKRLELTDENFRIKSRVKDNKTLFVIDMQIIEQNPDIKSIKYLLTSTGKVQVNPQNDTNVLLNNSDINSFNINSAEPYSMVEISLSEPGLKKIDEYLSLSNGKTSFSFLLDSTQIGSFNLDKTNFSDKIIFLSLLSTNDILKMKVIFESGIMTSKMSISNIESIR
jgi:hypothetical protein